jgi:thiol-disulfide isomerase/thioredoxin
MAEYKPFPFDFKLLDLDGKPFALASLKGKVVVVDVWGTWCPPCRAEVPHFVELQKTYGKQGLQIVGINYERAPDPIPGIKTFAKEYGINYPLVIGDDETQKKIPDFQAFPTTLFIDRKGDVRLVAVGARPHEYLESVVKKLLAETDPPDGLGPAPAGTKKTDKPATKKTTKPATKKTTKPATKKTTKPAGKTIDKPAATKKTAKPAAKKADKPAVKKTTDKT